jgi:hypothetical protein
MQQQRVKKSWEILPKVITIQPFPWHKKFTALLKWSPVHVSLQGILCSVILLGKACICSNHVQLLHKWSSQVRNVFWDTVADVTGESSGWIDLPLESSSVTPLPNTVHQCLLITYLMSTT